MNQLRVECHGYGKNMRMYALSNKKDQDPLRHLLLCTCFWQLSRKNVYDVAQPSLHWKNKYLRTTNVITLLHK